MSEGSCGHRPVLCAAVFVVVAVLTSCSNRDNDPYAHEPSAWERAGAAKPIVVAQPPPEPTRNKPTGNPSHDVLRLISDHHASVILMTHAIVESDDTTAILGEARKLEEEHDHELDRVAKLLRKRFNDSYAGEASVESRFVATSIRSRPSEDHAKMFVINTIKAEAALVAAMNAYLSGVTDSPTRELAGGINRNHEAGLVKLRAAFSKYLPAGPLN